MSLLNVNKVDPSTGTALELGSSGDTVSVPSGATLDISASTLTPPATMPASSGINLTALNATNLGSGTVPTARLGTGSASSAVFLAGDSTWIAAGGGKIGQVLSTFKGDEFNTTSTSMVLVTGLTQVITPAAASSKILVTVVLPMGASATITYWLRLYREISGGVATIIGNNTADGAEDAFQGTGFRGTTPQYELQNISFTFLDSPSTTSETSYYIHTRCDSGTLYVGRVGGSVTRSGSATLTVMEVLA